MLTVPTTDLKECRVCGKSEFDIVLDYGMMPLAGGFVRETDPLADAYARLRLVECLRCGLLQTYDCIPPDSIFRRYSYKSSVSQDLKNHFEALSKRVAYHIFNRRQKDVNRRREVPLVVEIGCNDGVFLEPMSAIIPEAILIGIDPSDVALESFIESESSWTLFNNYATTETAKRITSKYGKADVVVACNVLAHTDSPGEMIDTAVELLDDDGFLIVEVQYRVDLLERCQFDTVYHEHCSYFGVRDIAKLANDRGLILVNHERIPTHNGSIRVTFFKGRRPELFMTEFIVRTTQEFQDQWIGMIDGTTSVTPIQFAMAAKKARERLIRTFDILTKGIPYCQAFGAAGRATILLNWCSVGKENVSRVLDDSPLRQGRVVPGVKIPIETPDGPNGLMTKLPTVTVITAWNYAETIISKYPEYRGMWMVPLPEVRLI